MPKAAQPKPVAATPVQALRIDGNQDDHEQAALELCAKLGWSGEFDWELSGIAVVDAQNFVRKVLHEAFQAGGRNEPADAIVNNAIEHLALDEQDEIDALAELLNAAQADGYAKFKQVNPHGLPVPPAPTTIANAVSNIDLRNS